jgi:hypothetical protein
MLEVKSVVGNVAFKCDQTKYDGQPVICISPTQIQFTIKSVSRLS